MVSQRLRLEVMRARMRGERLYRLALQINTPPSTLSQLLSGAIPVQPGDQRIEKLGALLGLDPSACFVTRRSRARG